MVREPVRCRLTGAGSRASRSKRPGTHAVLSVSSTIASMTRLARENAEVIHRIQSETRRDRDYARIGVPVRTTP
jgi:hypothetical protein